MEKIEIYKIRGLGETVGAPFKFCKIHFKHFFGAFFRFCGPAILFMAFAMVLFKSQLMGFAKMNKGNFSMSDFSISSISFYIGLILLFIVVSIVNTTLTCTTVINYMNIYKDKGANFNYSELWEAIKNSFKKILGINLVFVGVYFLFVIIIVGLIGLSIIVTKGFVIGISIILTLLLFIAFILLFPYLLIPYFSMKILVEKPETSISQSIKEALGLIKLDYWDLFGSSLVMVISISMAMYALMIPISITIVVLTIIDPEGILAPLSPTQIITTFSQYFLQNIVSGAFLIGFSFIYYSQVEKRDGISIKQRLKALEE